MLGWSEVSDLDQLGMHHPGLVQFCSSDLKPAEQVSVILVLQVVAARVGWPAAGHLPGGICVIVHRDISPGISHSLKR